MNDKKTIRIACQGAATLDIAKMEPMQGELKSLSVENFERLKKSILELGFSFPIHIWRHKSRYLTCDGHQRERVLLKMREEGYEVPPVPVVWVEAKDAKEAKLKILGATSQYGAIETQGLYEFMSEANITFPDIESTFNFPEIDFKHFNDEFFTDPASDKDDEIPEPRKTDIKMGDMFKLGDHILLAGDATKAEDVAKLMGKEKADCVITDPPYGANISGMMQEVHGSQKSSPSSINRRWEQIQGDENEDKELQSFLEKAFKNISNHAKDNAPWYIWHAMLTQGFFAAAAAAADLLLNRQIIWVKPVLILAFGDYHWRHELCFYGWKKGFKPKFYGDKNKTTVWDMDFDGKGRMPASERQHPTQKPVCLAEEMAKNSSQQGDIIIDLFGGAGSTLIACEKTKRRCRMMEIDIVYCQVIIDRWQEFTGRKAIKCDPTPKGKL